LFVWCLLVLFVWLFWCLFVCLCRCANLHMGIALEDLSSRGSIHGYSARGSLIELFKPFRSRETKLESAWIVGKP
jgi:hypothetical protein